MAERSLALALTKAGAPLQPIDARSSDACDRRGPAANSRLRRVPHRSAHRRRRPRAAAAAAGSRTRDRRHRDRARCRCRSASASVIASASRGSARTCGSCAATAARGAKTCATLPQFTGYTRDGGYAQHAVARARLLLSAARGTRRRACGAAAVRGTDRLPRAAHGRRRARASASMASARRRTSSRRSRSPKGARSSRSRDRRTTPGKRSRARSAAAWAGGSDAPPPAALDAALIFAPVGALCRRRLQPPPKAASWSAPASI